LSDELTLMMLSFKKIASGLTAAERKKVKAKKG